MRRFVHAVLGVLVAAGMAATGAPAPQQPGPPTAEELSAGQALAEMLRSSLPEENSAETGKLIITDAAGTREVPISCLVSVQSNKWESDYQTAATNGAPAEHLIVIHETNGPSQYLYSRGSAPVSPVDKANESMPLAGSDFSLEDLGLEFLHWPVQRQLKGEMRLGQPCYVLESRNPGGQGIVRVRSDIDKDTHGLLIAEGYDAAGNLVKRFSLHASSFKKVKGHWQVEKMEIANKKTGSHTEMKFDLNNQ